MLGNQLIIVSDDQNLILRARNFAFSQGLALEVYSEEKWKEKNAEKSSSNPESNLISGEQNKVSFENVIRFPHPVETVETKVKSIADLEADAITEAIHEFNGNLTEAAKALGIGRATLYRKVKQYEIDTSLARRKRAA